MDAEFGLLHCLRPLHHGSGYDSGHQTLLQVSSTSTFDTFRYMRDIHINFFRPVNNLRFVVEINRNYCLIVGLFGFVFLTDSKITPFFVSDDLACTILTFCLHFVWTRHAQLSIGQKRCRQANSTVTHFRSHVDFVKLRLISTSITTSRA